MTSSAPPTLPASQEPQIGGVVQVGLWRRLTSIMEARSRRRRLAGKNALPLPERLALVWRPVKSFVLNFVGAGAIAVAVVSFVGLVLVPLITELRDEAITIAPILMPQDLERGGATPLFAAQRLRDALRRFGERANAPVRGPHLAASTDDIKVTVPNSPEDNLPEFVVPTVGLSVKGIAQYIRTYFGNTRRHTISGEITPQNDRLWLRLRLDGQAFYDSPNRVYRNEIDELFATAANSVFEATGPYLSTAALAEKDPDRAVDLAEQAIATYCPDGIAKCKEPRQVASWYNLVGSILHYKYRLVEASAKYQTAIKLDPAFAIARSNYAELLIEMDKKKVAEDEFREAIKLDPHLAAAHFNLAMLLRATGRGNDAQIEINYAMTEFREAIRSKPGSVNPRINFANALLSVIRYETDKLRAERMYEETIEQFRRAISLDPRSVAAHNGLGRALYQMSETLPPDHQDKSDLRKQAIHAFRKVVALDASFGDGYYNLGIVLRRRGKLDEADAAFQKEKGIHEEAVRRDPQYARGHRELGRLLRISERETEAIREYTTALDYEPNYTEAHRARGLARFYKGEFDDAVLDLAIVTNIWADELYWKLWLYLAEKRSENDNVRANASNRLQKSVQDVLPNPWPYPIAELFIGRKPPEDIVGIAKGNADWLCEARFYIGEWRLINNGIQEAIPDLMDAYTNCRHEFIEYLGAEAELRRYKII
jgi:tetratricopeptide (TPR) repeat protein